MVVVATYSESRNADNTEVSGGNTLNRYRGSCLWGARGDRRRLRGAECCCWLLPTGAMTHTVHTPTVHVQSTQIYHFSVIPLDHIWTLDGQCVRDPCNLLSGTTRTHLVFRCADCRRCPSRAPPRAMPSRLHARSDACLVCVGRSLPEMGRCNE